MKKSVALAIQIWECHIDTFNSFDLVNNNGNTLESETLSVSLFSALITLESMKLVTRDADDMLNIVYAIDYLKSSKYYSENNKSEH